MNYADASLTGALAPSPLIRKASKGTVIYRQDDPALARCEVVSGVVRTTYLFADGRRQITGFFFAGEVFGADQDFYKSSAEVVSQSADVRRSRWGALADDERALSRALELAENSVLLLGRRTALSRLAAFLVDIRTRTGERRHIQLPMPQADIADFLGLTVETVSRSFGELIRQRLIDRPEAQQVRILDLWRLNALAGVQFEGSSDQVEDPLPIERAGLCLEGEEE